MTSTITIYQLTLENDFGTYRREYFLTKRGLARYLKRYKVELDCPDTTWHWSEHLLRLW